MAAKSKPKKKSRQQSEMPKEGSGNVGKSYDYLKTIKDAVASDASHPTKHGITMQAHHVLSAEGIKTSRLGKELEHCGYDINHLNNLALIPSTLQGACHLGVQPHRSNHIALSENDEGSHREKEAIENDEGSHRENYHDKVTQKVRELLRRLEKACQGQPGKNREIIQAMNIRSVKVLNGIQNSPQTLPLTKVASNFVQGNHKGCAGVDNIPKVGKVGNGNCPVDRDHFGKHGKHQRDEGISIPKPATPYQLKVGR